MTTATISLDRAFGLYRNVSDEECTVRIQAARAKLGKDAVLLVHHYQRPDVYRYADLTGDSLKLSRLAAQLDSRYIVFCGVHFMAEVADILSKPEQIVMLPDLAAGCSMADMANLVKVERCWRELATVLDPDETITPVTYINSAADLKGVLRRAWRHRLHVQQRQADPGMVVRAPAEGAVLPRSASGPLDRLQDGHSPSTRWSCGTSTRNWAASRPSRSGTPR